MGRDRHSNRKILETASGLTITQLLESGLFKIGRRSGKILITRKNFFDRFDINIFFTVNINTRDPRDLLNYIEFNYEYQGKEYNFQQPIETQPVNLGGYRYFFICHSMKNGEYCGRRVKALYFADTIFCCRHCMELVYNHSRNHRNPARLYNLLSGKYENKNEELKNHRHPRKANQAKFKAGFYKYLADTELLKFMKKLTDRY